VRYACPAPINPLTLLTQDLNGNSLGWAISVDAKSTTHPLATIGLEKSASRYELLVTVRNFIPICEVTP
jgi:hypothetical protein